ncbi:sulfurtransferase [Sulfurimonas sp.]|uniref:sulfurtransferase n=1 Tax=Sulfurimonas sp. TaxID=2022749 RepID=UPI003D10AB7E
MKKVFPFLLLNLLFSVIYAKSLEVDLNTLNSHLQEYKILDARSEELYTKSHINGAINFPINMTYANLKLNGKIANPLQMQQLLQKLGLDIDDNVVIYDDGSFTNAARIFWALEVYGFKDVKLLETGFSHWRELHYPISNTTPKLKQSNYIATINNQKLATKFTTLLATKNPNYVIVDARTLPAYLGKISSAKRYGHIPKAINIPAHANISKDQNSSHIKSINSLKNLYSKIPNTKKVILYCTIGKASATNYFALRQLGYDVSNYDASWKEWGNDFSLDIENPSAQK